MSKKNNLDITCPKCADKQSAIIWTSLNATLDPKAREDLLNNRINRHFCKNCESELPLKIGLLYHDMERGFCVQYVPMEFIARENLIARFNSYGNLAEGFDPEAENLKPYNYMDYIHLVFSMNELIRYVLFREKLFSDYYKQGSSNKISS